MWYIAGSLIVLGVLAAVFNLWEECRRRKKVSNPKAVAIMRPADCCGQHDVCDRLLATVGKQPEYYDDEELDAYCGMSSDAYSDEATEVFREVLYTLRASEVVDWLRSLQLREIALPDALKDEAILIVEGTVI